MPKNDAVWGIDIGQSALKALRCRAHEEPTRLVADAFDYIEYPKILSQPEADAAQLVKEALQEFLSRNKVKGDRVAVSVPGQSGLARFIKLPPVESKKIPDIVKYEAKQQIPFPLDEVVWDYQQMPGGNEAEGFALDTEVGLFAMKRDQVARSLKPFKEMGIEVDVLQLTPLALFNMVAFDQMPDLPPVDQVDPSSLQSVVLMSMGTDTTDLVVTNGYRVWHRSVSVGGNHFTKALTKELKLTFAKAELTKRNAGQSENPKAVFQAMRPVFNDLATVVQQSLNYYQTLDRSAKFSKIIGLGNVMKLPGLQRFLQQNLEMEVVKLDEYARLSGSEVVGHQSFQQNLLAFASAYGLCVQALREPRIRTNLIPREIVQERMVRAKKPWAVACAASLLAGMSASYFGYWLQYSSAAPAKFEQAVSQAGQVSSQASTFKSEYDSEVSKYKSLVDLGKSLVVAQEPRLKWLKVYKAINASLPRDEGEQPAAISERNQLHITSVRCNEYEDLSTWFSKAVIAEQWAEQHPAPGGAGAADGAEPAAPEGGPSGPGWVFVLDGYHYHNDPNRTTDSGAEYVKKTLIHNLEQKTINGVPVGELGISHPVVIHRGRPVQWEIGAMADPMGNPVDAAKEGIKGYFPFRVEFVWKEPEPAAEGETPADGADLAVN